MPFFILTLLVQVGFAIHAVKTGRDMKWLYFIILFPLVGCAVYFFVEVLPALQHSSTARKAQKTVIGTIDPNRGLRKSAEKLEISNNIDNTVAFAEECVERGHYDQAIESYAAARKGIFQDDPKLLLGLAHAQFSKGDFPAAVATLDHLRAANPGFKSADGHLLYARALEGQGATEKAVHEYEALVQYYPGPEAKCRYAQYLKQLGQPARAAQLFDEVRLAAKHSPRHYTRMHKPWIDMAKRES